MSRTVRKQLMEIADTLQKANELLANLLEGTPTEEMINLLTDCQNCAITMGNKIETVYGNGTASVHTLEEYCESIFQISQNLDNLPECMGIYEASKSQLITVREQLEKEIPDKLEVAFMPYKASMWDSLESVYLAAREDEKCEAYVVPIPYFDRRADKSLGEMHYEGAQYPKNIPITDWEQYDFEERMPDVIYIHNAYDDMNLVTCVHPRFFSSNLKKYTEKLVYIPYFVLEEIDPSDQKKIDGIKHFCFLPGIVNADKVIVQSENMRQIYINEYAKVIESAGGLVDRKQLEKKFLGTGSPKFDKVLNTRKEDLEIPEEWLKIIQKPDGSWKKIIFYNTSVTALLQHGEKMLEKMKDVFRIFKENQNEVALLWRPHPLIKTTIESMKPELWEEYEKLVECYKEEGWGIYDDTADMDRAVVLSDGYYGDHSSIIELVSKCNKPVVIQAVEWEYKRKLFFYDCVWQNNEIYYPLANFNALCQTNLLSGETKIIDVFPKNEHQNVLLYAGIYGNEKYLMFGPVKAKQSSLLFYDFKKKIFKEIAVDENKKSWLNFREDQVFKTEEFLYIFPCVSVVIKIKLCDLSIEYLTYPEISLGKERHGQLARVGQNIFIPLCNNPIIYKFDIITEKFYVYKIPCNIKGIDTLCYDGKEFWLTGVEKGIYSWNEQTNECKRYLDYPMGFDRFVSIADEPGKWFSYSLYFEGVIYFIPHYANMIVKFGLVQHEMQEIFVPNEEEQLDEWKRNGRFSWGKYTVAKHRCGKLLLLSNKNKVIYLLDLKNNELKKVNLTMKSCEQKINWQEKVMEEQCQNGISDLIRYIEM